MYNIDFNFENLEEHLFYVGTTNTFIIAHTYLDIIIEKEILFEHSYKEPVQGILTGLIDAAPELGAVYLGRL